MQTSQIAIAPEVRCEVPEVLLVYLLDLLVSDSAGLDALSAACVLSAIRMGGRPIQQIEFLGRRHLVFGFEPVNCNLHVEIGSSHSELGTTA